MNYNIEQECTLSSVPVTDLVSQYGSPLYVYDIERITSQYNKMTNHFSLFPHKIHFACKANTNVSIIKHLRKLGCGIDAVSPGEIQVALKAGVPKEDIIFTPSGPSLEEISFSSKLGVMITLDSLSSLRYWGQNFVE